MKHIKRLLPQAIMCAVFISIAAFVLAASLQVILPIGAGLFILSLLFPIQTSFANTGLVGSGLLACAIGAMFIMPFSTPLIGAMLASSAALCLGCGLFFALELTFSE